MTHNAILREKAHFRAAIGAACKDVSRRFGRAVADCCNLYRLSPYESHNSHVIRKSLQHPATPATLGLK